MECAPALSHHPQLSLPHSQSNNHTGPLPAHPNKRARQFFFGGGGVLQHSQGLAAVGGSRELTLWEWDVLGMCV